LSQEPKTEWEADDPGPKPESNKSSPKKESAFANGLLRGLALQGGLKWRHFGYGGQKQTT